MDFSALVKTLVTEKTVNEVSKKSGASKKDVSSVLTTALPLLLSNSNTSAAQVSASSGVSQSTTNSVLTTAAPLLLGSLGGGQNNAQQSTAATNIALISAVLGKLDLSKLTSGLMNLVSTNTAAPASEAAEEKPASGKKPSTAKKPAAKKPASATGKKPAAKKPASATGKKTSAKKTESAKKEAPASALDKVSDLLGNLLK